jgi:hypothetical protein
MSTAATDDGYASRKRPLSRPSASSSRWNTSHLLIEAFALATVIFVSAALYDGDPGARPDVRLLWIPIFLMSAQYGALGGVFATAIATAMLYAFYLPARAIHQDFYAYMAIVASQPLQWLTYAVFVGGLRSLQIFRSAEVQEEFEETVVTAREIGDGLERALAEIERLERRLFTNTATAGEILRAVSNLNFDGKHQLLTSFADFVSCATGASDFAIYLNSSDETAPLYRVVNEFLRGQSEAPVLGLALRDLLSREAPAISCLDPEMSGLLPAGAICAVPLDSEVGGKTAYVLLIERLDSQQDVALAIERAEALGRSLGRMLRLVTSSHPTPGTAS